MLLHRTPEKRKGPGCIRRRGRMRRILVDEERDASRPSGAGDGARAGDRVAGKISDAPRPTRPNVGSRPTTPGMRSFEAEVQTSTGIDRDGS